MTGSATTDGQTFSYRFLQNISANLTGQVAILLLAFFITPYLIHHFGPTLYGVLALLLVLLEALVLIEVGLQAALVKYLAELLPQNRSQDANAYFQTTLILSMAGGVLVAIVFACATPWVIRSLLNIPADLQASIVWCFQAASVAVLLRFLGLVFSAVPVAMQRFDIVNAVNVAVETLRILGFVGAIAAGYMLEGVVSVMVLTAFLRSTAYGWLSRRLAPELTIWPRFSAQHCRSMLRFSKSVAIAHGIGQLTHILDRVIIGINFPATFVAFYDVPYQLAQKLWIAAGSVTSVVLPAASALSSALHLPRLRALYFRGSKAILAFTIFPALLLFLYSPEILTYWINPQFAAQGAPCLQMLSCGFLLNCLGNMPNQIVLAANRPQLAVRFSGLNAALSIMLFLTLIPTFGIIGAAAGFLISQAVLVPLFVHFTNGMLNVRWQQFVLQSVAPPLLAALVAGVILLILRPWVSSLWSLVLASGAGGAAFLVAAAFLVLNREERDLCLAYLRGRFAARHPARKFSGLAVRSGNPGHSTRASSSVADKDLTIGFVSHSAGRHGAELALLDLIDGLQRNRLRCAVLLPERGPLMDELERRKVRCAIVPYKWWCDRWELDSSIAKRVLRNIFNLCTVPLVALYFLRCRVDLVYTNTATVPVGALAAWVLRKPHVWHLHEFVGKAYGLAPDLGIDRTFRVISGLSDAVVANSHAVKAQYSAYIQEGLQCVIYPGLSTVKLRTATSRSECSRPRSATGALKLAVVGRICEGKGQLDAVRAVAELAKSGINVSLRLIGTKEAQYGRVLNDYIEEHKLQDRIEFTGYLTDPLPAMSEADIVLVCSRFEGFGRVTVESMYLGKPVLGTTVGGTRELIQEGITGLLYTPGEVRELTQHLRRCAASPIRVQAMGRAAQEWVEKRFTVARYASEMTALFHRILARRFSRAR